MHFDYTSKYVTVNKAADDQIVAN